MKTVVVDGYITNPGDLKWDNFEEFGEVIIYERTADTDNDQLMIERIKDADAIIVNANTINRNMMENAPKLRLISVSATGFDNVDIKCAKELGIAVTNVPGYSTDAVAQHTIALLLELTNHVALHDKAIRDGEWFNSPDSCFTKKPLSLLARKSLGIVGYGMIGKKVAQIASAFGMDINIYSKDKEKTIKSDIISLHCPLTEETREMINKEIIDTMKDGVILINTARGGLVNEKDLAEALKSGKVSAYGADVLAKEPPAPDNPLLYLDNCILTPHIGWIPKEAREYLLNVCYLNQKSFLDGEKLNRVDL